VFYGVEEVGEAPCRFGGCDLRHLDQIIRLLEPGEGAIRYRALSEPAVGAAAQRSGAAIFGDRRQGDARWTVVGGGGPQLLPWSPKRPHHPLGSLFPCIRRP
jgi:hypothetical protein